jgi:hypothetical protein
VAEWFKAPVLKFAHLRYGQFYSIPISEHFRGFRAGTLTGYAIPYHCVLSRLGPHLGPKKPPSPHENTAWGRIMTDLSVETIPPPDLAKAFAESVVAYNDWSPGQPEREIRIERSFFSITLICGLVEQFTDQLPEHVFSKLRSCMHDIPDGDLIVELAVNCSYATAARCLRRMIFRRKAEYRQRDTELR